VIELRIRTKVADEVMRDLIGTPVTPDLIGAKLEGPARVLKPDGKPLCVYLPGAAREVADATFDEFSRIRNQNTNRGYASGSKRVPVPGSKRSVALPVSSEILGSFDPLGRLQYCRLTAFTAKQVERWTHLQPYFRRIGELFEEHVPERYTAQVAEVQRTPPEWIIQGTPFTTITVNNTYPTGIHTDKGDLDAGFSNIGCMRRGAFTGGWLTFPQYGVAVDLQHGDVLLMDAHEWHGNTPIICSYCGESLRKFDHECPQGGDVAERKNIPWVPPERVSVVSYYRTKMAECGTADEELDRRAAVREALARKSLGLDEDDQMEMLAATVQTKEDM